MLWLLSILVSVALGGPVQRYAVVVGTNTGVGDDEPLIYAERDAERMSRVLTDLGDVRSEDVVSLRDVDADRVVEALADLGARIRRNDNGSETLLFFYYSGHADSDAVRLNNTTLPFAELTALLQELPVDVRVLIVDACQSGELTRLKGATPAEPFTIVAEDRLDSEGLAIITSSSLGEDAQESDRLQGGVFTHHLVAGLMGAADASGDGRVTLTEVYRYGSNATIRSTSKARFVQHPSYAWELRGRDDLVLTKVTDPGRSASLELNDPGQWIVFDLRGGQVVTELQVTGESVLVIPPGAYLLRVRTDSGIREEAVELRRGETVTASARHMTPVTLGRTVRKGLEEDRRAAVALAIGGGVLGPTSPGIGAGPTVHVGLWIELEPMTLGLRGTSSFHRHDNDYALLNQGRFGIDASGIKKFDVGPLSPGIGVRGGTDWVLQTWETDGDAPLRQAVTGRVGPVLSVDLAMRSNTRMLSLAAGADVQLYRRWDAVNEQAHLETLAVPSLTLELAQYLR